VLGTGIRESANAVSLMVVVLEERARQALEARYGAGAVQATAVLTPVAQSGGRVLPDRSQVTRKNPYIWN
jgi:hypothetical protein